MGVTGRLHVCTRQVEHLHAVNNLDKKLGRAPEMKPPARAAHCIADSRLSRQSDLTKFGIWRPISLASSAHASFGGGILGMIWRCDSGSHQKAIVVALVGALIPSHDGLLSIISPQLEPAFSVPMVRSRTALLYPPLNWHRLPRRLPACIYCINQLLSTSAAALPATQSKSTSVT
ncbi:hypothetical protein K458DRAFT_388652 [Lentithecium fluviatile CBS 122367]|uniref:Uncharacterized protein n=1 Tax=Lentithecium fluviatile CBS 122367 TaxID=1168545 RepID=A0A6G1J353_9PLEO|nr:hypothetical protein K458DRAFT_388652 [Lentithecium fluviatile CBS 122367]